MYDLKIYRRVLCYDSEEYDTKFEEEWLLSSKLTWRIWEILTQALENLKNLLFDRLLLTKVYSVWVKKVKRSYFWWHWIVMENSKEKWLVLSKMAWGILPIFTRACWEVWTLGLWWCPFIQSTKYKRLKFTGDFCVMTVKNMIQNLKRNWLVNLKLIWRIWQILTQALENLKNLLFNRVLLTKVYNVYNLH